MLPQTPHPLWNLPNLISSTRFIFAAAFIVFDHPWVRALLILLAGGSDWLDGWLARRSGSAQTSKIGALIDPLSDRLFVFVVISVYLFEGLIVTAEYFVFIARDLMTAIGFLVARAMPSLRPVTFKARFSGKVVTTLQLAAIFAVVMFPKLAAGLFAAVGVTAVWAVLDYTMMLHRHRVRG